ncbi:MAG: SpoIIE family protein phosphatase, partial [Saprospirales bacterium]|nr:SpoIIE family protein phosphatase [Saprospirales bacterium]
ISLESGSTLLGIFEELPSINFGSIKVKPNTSLFCVTDGLTELENDEEEQFGTERFLQLIKENYKLSPEIFNKILFDNVSKYKGNMLFNDDVSVLTAKFY